MFISYAMLRDGVGVSAQKRNCCGGNGTRIARSSLCISPVLRQRANSRLMLDVGAGAWRERVKSGFWDG